MLFSPRLIYQSLQKIISALYDNTGSPLDSENLDRSSSTLGRLLFHVKLLWNASMKLSKGVILRFAESISLPQ